MRLRNLADTVVKGLEKQGMRRFLRVFPYETQAPQI